METKKILIVDDDIDVITVVKAILTNNGYEVVSANDKIEGIKKAWTEKPDLAILDVMMTTHFEGFEMAKELSENPDFNKMPVMMLSSIDILTTTKPSVQEMAREFRQDPNYRELDVLLIKDVVSGNAGVDYKSEEGPSVWLKVDGFLRKPVEAEKLLAEIQLLLDKKAKATTAH
ncbi:MAG: response regulator [Bacteroidales bacterium]|nr:response regulator [Bacteroidales bacterium]